MQNPVGHSEAGLSRKILMVFIVLAILGAFALVTFLVVKANEKPQGKKRSFNTLAVIADRAVQEDVELEITTQGEARPQSEIDLVPQVGGKITFVSPNFIRGGIFKKGETLVRIEDADFQVAVIRASANVAQAEQQLVREIAEGEIARQDYAELGRGQPSALALRQPQRQQAEAALQAAKADLENAKLQLTRTNIVAPFNGRVRSKSSDIGQFVSPGTPLGRIFSTQIVEVSLPLTDSDLQKIDLPIAFVAKNRASAPSVELSAIVAGERQVWSGKIMRTDSLYDTQTRALFAIVEVYDPYVKGVSNYGVPLAPGLFVDAALKGRVYNDAITFSRDGLRPDSEVFIVDHKGKAEIRKVEVLDTNSDRAVLKSGVESGELVVLSPMERSWVETPLRVLDAHDPSITLATPEQPDWLKQQLVKDAEEKAKAESERPWWKIKLKKEPKPLKKKDPENSNQNPNENSAALARSPGGGTVATGKESPK